MTQRRPSRPGGGRPAPASRAATPSGSARRPAGSGIRAAPGGALEENAPPRTRSAPSRRAPSRGGGGRPSRRTGGRSRKRSGGGALLGIGGFVLVVALIIGSRVACSIGVMEYQDSQFRGEVKRVAAATDDPEYWNFLVDEFHDSSLSQSQKVNRRGAAYDPDKYGDIIGEKIRRQLETPDPAIVARFKQRYNRDPHLTDIDIDKLPPE